MLAYDIEDVPGAGGLNSLVESVLAAAQNANIPVICPLNKKELGTVIKNPAVSLSVVCILNYESADDLYKQLLNLAYIPRVSQESTE